MVSSNTSGSAGRPPRRLLGGGEVVVRRAMPAIVPPATDFPAEPRPARREARFIRFSHFAARFVPVCVTERMKR
jgi:hypothetical protein